MIRLPRGRVAVTSIPDPDISKGGIIIPNEARERDDQGFIKYLGEDCEDFEVGEYVLFSGYTGTLVHLEDEGSLIIMHKDFIIAKIEDPGTQVPGLYYRDKKGWGEVEDKIAGILALEIKNNERVQQYKDAIMHAISESQPYFPADSENAISLIAQAYQNHPFHRATRIGWKHGSKINNRHG
jgi:co-chaperonin GroES (HSP10)